MKTDARLNGCETEGGKALAVSTTGKHAAQPESPPTVEKKKKPAPKRRRESIFVGLAMVFVLLLILAFSLRGAAEERRYQEHVQAAADCYAAGDYENALGHLRQATAKEETEEMRLLMADCYHALGSYDKALEILRSMNMQDERISRRIDVMEYEKDLLRRAGTVEIAGREYERTLTSLVIRETVLSGEDLDQIAELYSLTSLSLTQDGLTDLSAISGLGGLTMLDLCGNALSDLSPLRSFIGLRTLYLDGNPITDFSPLYELQELRMLSIRSIQMTEQQLSELSAALPSCVIHSDTVLEEVNELTLGGVTFLENVTELDLSGQQLSDLSALSTCHELVKLDLSNNKIKDLTPLMDLPKLERLNLAGNAIVDLKPLMAMKSLLTIDISNNSVCSTAALAQLTELKELSLAGNQLDDLNGLSELGKLESLDLENTRLSNEKLEVLCGIKSLRQLNIKENPDLTGEAVDELKRSLRSCSIEHSRLVYTAEINGQRYRQDMTSLDISGTGKPFDLSPFSLMSSLEKLRLSDDALVNIYSLQSLYKLRELDLSDNQISDVTPLAYMNSLEKLNLANNPLSSVTALLNLSQLKELDVRGTGITEEQLEKLESVLINCLILRD